MNGRVTGLWRYPVKSMLGEQLDETDIGPRGIPGDRAFALVDVETGKVCSAKRHDLWGRLFEFRSRLDGQAAIITFPDGTHASSADADIADLLSRELGRDVRLDDRAPERARYEEVWDDEVKGTNYYGPEVSHDGTTAVIDVPASMASPGGFFDFAPIHLITTNTVEELSRLEPEVHFDVRRFRPNIVVEAEGGGFVENDWSKVHIGDVELEVIIPVPRCVMTTLAQDDLQRDPRVLRATARHNMLDTKLLGEMPCAGVYASVTGPGRIQLGAPVAIG